MSLLNPLILQVDCALRTLFAKAKTTRPMPGEEIPEAELSGQERSHAAALMRVDHAGEVCAQALYAGQAFAAQDGAMRQALDQAAREETEHLNWTGRRIEELGGRKSLLNPLWYAGAWTIGAAAGKLGDDISLGFLAETERQVEAHLDGHMDQLPAADLRSLAVISQMKADEIKHARHAVQLGARELPEIIKGAMGLAARVMTGTAYRI